MEEERRRGRKRGEARGRQRTNREMNRGEVGRRARKTKEKCNSKEQIGGERKETTEKTVVNRI